LPVSAGDIQAVPLPAAFWFFSIGIGAFLIIQRSKAPLGVSYIAHRC
jgi:hypothetical protein